MSDDREGLDAVLARVEAALARFALWPEDSVIIGPHAAHPHDTPPVSLADLRALVSALREARADTKRLDWLNHAVPSGEFRKATERTLGATLPVPFDIRAALDAAIHGEVGG